MNDIQFRKNYSAFIGPAYPAQPGGQEQQKTQKTGARDGSFSQILQQTVQKQGGLTFSKHALQRMDARQIEISPERMAQMNDAVEKARSKGVRDALILDGSNAFIVNIPSATVVTTMNGGEMKENIFTNIDGAVIL